MNRDDRFLHVLAELDTLVVPGASRYGMERIALLLRQLLLDGSKSLVDQVNRSRGVPLIFMIGKAKGVPGGWPYDWALLDGFDPDPPSRPGKEVSRDDLFRQVIMGIGGRPITVKEAIDNVAYVQGGVHAGEPKKEAELALHEAERLLRVDGYPPDVRVMQAIGRVVLKGLAPLRDRVRHDASVS